MLIVLWVIFLILGIFLNFDLFSQRKRRKRLMFDTWAQNLHEMPPGSFVIGKTMSSYKIGIAISSVLILLVMVSWIYLAFYQLEWVLSSGFWLLISLFFLILILGLVWSFFSNSEELWISKDGITQNSPARGNAFLRWEDVRLVSIISPEPNSTGKPKIRLTYPEDYIIDVPMEIIGPNPFIDMIKQKVPREKWDISSSHFNEIFGG